MGNQSRGSRGGGNGRRRRSAARGGSGSTARSRGLEKVGGRGKMVGEHPYPTTVLLGRLAEGKERRIGGATGGRSSAMAGGGGARCARVSWAKDGGCGLGRGARARGYLNRGGQAPGRAGPRPRAARNGAIRRPDSDSSPSWARGGRRPRQVGPTRQ
jgi:hypothetical protein